MNIKIVNLKRFIVSTLLIFLAILFLSLIISNKSFSHGEITYKTIIISSGDTLWSIAKEEKNSNVYYEGKDLRDIIDNIKSINNIKSSNLKINQEIKIPTL